MFDENSLWLCKQQCEFSLFFITSFLEFSYYDLEEPEKNPTSCSSLFVGFFFLFTTLEDFIFISCPSEEVYVCLVSFSFVCICCFPQGMFPHIFGSIPSKPLGVI